MKKMIRLGLLALFVALMASGQEKVEAPVEKIRLVIAYEVPM